MWHFKLLYNCRQIIKLSRFCWIAVNKGPAQWRGKKNKRRIRESKRNLWFRRRIEVKGSVSWIRYYFYPFYSFNCWGASVDEGRARKCGSWLEFLKKFVHLECESTWVSVLLLPQIRSPSVDHRLQLPAKDCWLGVERWVVRSSCVLTDWVKCVDLCNRMGRMIKMANDKSVANGTNCSFRTHNIEIAHNNINFHPQAEKNFLSPFRTESLSVLGNNNWAVLMLYRWGGVCGSERGWPFEMPRENKDLFLSQQSPPASTPLPHSSDTCRGFIVTLLRGAVASQ